MSADLTRLIEQLLRKSDSSSKETELGHSGSSGSIELKIKAMVTPGQENRVLNQSVTGHIDLTDRSRVQTKVAKLECPRFDGENF